MVTRNLLSNLLPMPYHVQHHKQSCGIATCFFKVIIPIACVTLRMLSMDSTIPQIQQRQRRTVSQYSEHPPFSDLLPLLTSHTENAEQKHKQLIEDAKGQQHERPHIAKDCIEVGSSCSLQGVESAERQVHK